MPLNHPHPPRRLGAYRIAMAIVAGAALGACGGGHQMSTTPAPDTPAAPGPQTPGQATYTIGGTATGLAGTLILQNGAGEVLSVDADGAFSFTTAVDAGASYNVTLRQAPALQACQVSNGAGVASAPVTDISVSCGGTVEVSTIAGTGIRGHQDGPAATAAFDGPAGVAVKADGTVYVTEFSGQRLRRIATDGTVSTVTSTPSALFGLVLAGDDAYAASVDHTIVRIAADGSRSIFAGSAGLRGDNDGQGAAASFRMPYGLTRDQDGHIYVAEASGHRIRKITPDATVTTLAGSGTVGFADGMGAAAQFDGPFAVAAAADGTLYVADSGNHRIRRVSPAGEVSTLAGTGAVGAQDGAASAATFNQPSGLALAPDGSLFVVDNGSQRIRKISPAGLVSTVAGTGVIGWQDGPPGTAAFNRPLGIALHPDGSLIVTEEYGHRLRRIGAH